MCNTKRTKVIMEIQWTVGACSLPSLKQKWNRNSRWLRQVFELTELGLDLQKPKGPKLLPCINHWHDFLFFIFSMICHGYLAPLGMTGKIEKKKAWHLEKSKLPLGACMRFVFQNALLFVEGRLSLITCPLQIHAKFCFMVVRGRSLNFAIVKLKKFLEATLFLLWNGKTIAERQIQRKSVSVVEKNARVMWVLFSLL